MEDPIIYAPESGILIYQSDINPPKHIFGVIKTTHELVEINMDHEIRSDLVPFADTVFYKYKTLSTMKRMGSAAEIVSGDAGLITMPLTLSKEEIERTQANLLSECHFLKWRIPKKTWRAPDWGNASRVQRNELFQEYLGPPSSQHTEGWSLMQQRLREISFDFSTAGLPDKI